ncbi:MAG: DUF4249 family protein [Candidatus Kapabacteria bacterium]|jgi:hypothetical protein|nr:DUF4249 family protein [Candidatus Kapabacteria bacterium]
MKFLVKHHKTSYSRHALCLIVSVVLFANMLSSCTQSVTNIELPFDEKILIEGVLVAGKSIDNISITKTYPPLTTLASISTLYLPDAEVTLRVDGQSYKPEVRFDSLRYSVFQGNFSSQAPQERYIATPKYSFPNLTATTGKTYEITVTWRGKTAVGKATVPTAANLGAPTVSGTSITFDSVQSGGQFVAGRFTPTYQAVARLNVAMTATMQSGFAYRLSFYSPDTASFFRNIGDRFQSFTPNFVYTESNWRVLPDGITEDRAGITLFANVRPSETTIFPSSGPPTFTVQPMSDLVANLRKLRFFAVLTATEAAYSQWNETRFFGFSYGSGFPFSGSGTQNPTWNITGDGMGIFVGAQSREIPILVQ